MTLQSVAKMSSSSALLMQAAKRVPMIKFVGKRSPLKYNPDKFSFTPLPTNSQITKNSPSSNSSSTFVLPSNFRRQPISQEECEMINASFPIIVYLVTMTTFFLEWRSLVKHCLATKEKYVYIRLS
uniref:Ovule protein n=1 Tax=Rhabditophanes sp. KR3021 TaxID=114890 RepID=A0AC35UBI9_9BILA